MRPEEEVDRREGRLRAISGPVTPEEAAALATCFGPDDCYGVAWTLLHLIETAPGPVPQLADPGPDAGDWAEVLRTRWGREGRLDLAARTAETAETEETVEAAEPQKP